MERGAEFPDIVTIVADDRGRFDRAGTVRAEARELALELYNRELRRLVESAAIKRTLGDSNKGFVTVTADLIPGNLIRRRIVSNGRHFAEIWVDEVASGLQVGCTHLETSDLDFSSFFQ